MEIVEFIIVLFMALLVASIFFYGFRSRGPWSAFWVFLLILFLAGLAGRLWVTPAGPLMWGFGWLPVLVFVFIVALLLAVASPRDDEGPRRSEIPGDMKRSSPEREAGAVFGIFFWILMIFFFTAIIAGLYRFW